MAVEFHNTQIGRQFLDGTMPDLVKTLKGIEKCLKEDQERRTREEAVSPPATELLNCLGIGQSHRDQLSDLHSWVLEFLGDDHGSTDHDELSFECGILATVDWLVGANSIYAEIINEALEEWEEDHEPEDQS